METSVKYYYDEFNEIRALYSNLYYINNKFIYITTKKDIQLLPIKIFRCDDILHPTVMVFESMNDINVYLNKINYQHKNGVTGYLSHYYDWNVAHGLYDTLYPFYLTCMIMFDTHSSINFNAFIKLKFIDGWAFPGIASRDWVIDIFKTFLGGEIIHENNKNIYTSFNYKFSILIAGHASSGISNVNKFGVMPGKNIRALEHFRDRMLEKYGVLCVKSNIPRIKIIDSTRYTTSERNILIKLNETLKKEGYISEYLSWANIQTFKEQLTLIANTDIHISGPGTSMLNFPFMTKDKININLGASNIVGCKIPGYMEINICLLSNEICTVLYDIVSHHTYDYNSLYKLIKNNITLMEKKSVSHTPIPKYINVWNKYCMNDNSMETIIKRMNGEIMPHLLTYRWIECLVYEHGPFDKNTKLIDNNLLTQIKQKLI